MHLSFESEWMLVGHPTGGLRLQLIDQVRSHVKIARARPAAKPFDGTASCKVHVQFFNAERHGPGRLISVEHDQRADFMCAFRDRFRILQEGALEKNVRYRNEQSLF